MPTKGLVIQNANFKPCLSDLRSLILICIIQIEHTLMFYPLDILLLFADHDENFRKKILHMLIEISFDNIYKSNI